MEPRGLTPRLVRFGVFELDRRSGELRKDGVLVRLQEQPLRVLDALLAEPGEPVTREVLRQRLWPDDTFVDFDNGLNRAINRLRATLGDEADNPRFIETLERRGYRFIAPLAALDTSTPASSTPETTLRTEGGYRRTMWLAGAAAAAALAALLTAFAPALWRRANPEGHAPIRSLAVLPLANLTGDPAQEYFSDGMTEALITNLASLPAIRVISRQSVMRYKGSAKPLPEIARELGVEGVVEGSVVRSAGHVRVTAQLIHAPTDRHLWAHSYERRLEDVLALQGELSRAIGEQVRIRVGTEANRQLAPPRRVNPDAYDAYLLGRHHWNRRTERSLDQALAYFQAAIAKDPDFALAHAGLALAYSARLISGYVPPGRGLSEQKAAALRALELDPGLGEARAALAVVREQEWDWEGAEAEFRSALETDPNSTIGHFWYGWYLSSLGRFDESLAQRRRALELDPLNTVVNRALAGDLGALGRDEEALAQWNRALELEPDHVSAHLELAVFHFERGRAAAGSRHLERAGALAPHDPSILAHLAIVHALIGNGHEADRAFALLEDAYAAKDPLLIPIQAWDTREVLRLSAERAAPLRSDPRFGDLVRRMGFVPRVHAPRTRRTP